MAFYRTSKCPYCKTTLEFMVPTYWNNYRDDFGPSIAQCTNCNNEYRTRRSYWHRMSGMVHFKIELKIAASVFIEVVYGVAGLSMLLGILITLEILSDIRLDRMGPFWPLIILFILILVVWRVKSNLIHLTRLKKIGSDIEYYRYIKNS